MAALTIGMATYGGFDGVYFTIQAFRLCQDLTDTDLLLVDNLGPDDMQRFVEGVPDAHCVRLMEVTGTKPLDSAA